MLSRCLRLMAAVLAGYCLVGPAAADIALAGVTEARGAGAAPGNSFRNGYAMAIAEVNAAGGVLGHALVLRQFDIDTSAAAAQDGVKQALALEPFAVLGPVFSGLTMAAMPQTAALRTPHFTGGEATSLTRQFHPSLLRTSLTQQESIPRLCAFTVFGLGARRLGLLWIDNEFGRSGRAVLLDSAHRRGAAVGFEASVAPGQKDWSAVVRRLVAARVDALVLVLTEEESVDALRELRRQHFTAPIVGDGPMVSSKVIADAQESADGVIGHTGVSTDLPTAAMAQFAADYQRRFGARPDHNSLKGYFAVQALRIALEAVGRVDRAAVLDYLKSTRLDGRKHASLLSASVRYDLFGDLDRESYVLQARGGRMRLLATMSALDPKFVALPGGRTVPLNSDEFQRAVQAILAHGDAPPAAKPRR